MRTSQATMTQIGTRLPCQAMYTRLFHNMNLETCQWVEHQEWWHRTTFKAPADREDDGARYLLTFGGLDTLATDAYAYFVRLTVPIDRTGFSDNYFDLFPSQERVIMVWNETGWRLDDNDIAVSCL
jgi:hypothetical protein